MEVLITLIFIGILIYQAKQIDKLNTQIYRLKKELKKYKQQAELTNNSNQEVNAQSINMQQHLNTESVRPLSQEEKGDEELKRVIASTSNANTTIASSSTSAPRAKVQPKPKMDPVASRNLSILITGSILIVLAAIAFLTTTWHSIPSFIKTIVLFLVAFVFIGASKISKEKYHLEKAGKTFFYIGMAYLPICFLSISIFGLFGEYLSATGEGEYIYLGVSTLILSFLYYFISKTSNDRYLFYGSLLSQILSVILFTLMFEERLFLVCINLLLYNLLVMAITKDKIFENIVNVLPIVIVVMTVLNIPNILILSDISWYFIITCLLIAVNFLGLELKGTNIAKSIVFNTFLYIFIYELIFKMDFELADGKCQFLIILFTVAITIVERILFNYIKENKNLKLTAMFVPSVLLGICALTIGGEGASWYFVAMCLLLSISFMELELKETNIAYAIAFNLCLFLFGYGLVFNQAFKLSDGTYQVLIILFTIAVYVIENLLFSTLKESENLEISSRIASLFSLGYIYIVTIFEGNSFIISSYVIAMIIECSLVFNLFKSKNKIYKYLVYIFSNILLVDVTENLLVLPKLDKFVPMITTTLIMFYEMYSVKEKDEFVTLYTLGFQALSLILITIGIEEFVIVLALAFAFFSIYYNRKMGLVQWFDAIPLMCLLYCTMNSGLSEEFEIGVMLILTIGITYFSVSLGKVNVYTLISAAYLFGSAYKISNEYIMELLLILWGIIHAYSYEDKKLKDIFKVITSFFGVMLYYSIIKDAELFEITLFRLLGIVVEALYVLEIVSKYFDDLDVMEYAFWGVIYLYALTSYTDSTDGMMFGALIVAIIFYSYYKKYGATFLCAIAAILVNAFALTREFWLGIPWWIYLLVVGGTLVGFAVKNEASDNKKKISVGSIIKEIKDKVEK